MTDTKRISQRRIRGAAFAALLFFALWGVTLDAQEPHGGRQQQQQQPQQPAVTTKEQPAITSEQEIE
ncbi:MAG: hypothetical protein LC747_06205, partial [Acidobacteria bacterium]|nr:hypothetical protein [Acidobacteriota bacterium]